MEATKPGGYHRWENILTLSWGNQPGFDSKEENEKNTNPQSSSISVRVMSSHVTSRWLANGQLYQKEVCLGRP